MLEYIVSGKCPHCGGLTLLERMDEARFKRTEPALVAILHTVICSHCTRRFGTGKGQLVRQSEEN